MGPFTRFACASIVLCASMPLRAAETPNELTSPDARLAVEIQVQLAPAKKQSPRAMPFGSCT